MVKQVERESPVPAVTPLLSSLDPDREFVQHFLATYTSPELIDSVRALSHQVLGALGLGSETAYIVYERREASANATVSSSMVLPLLMEEGQWRMRLTNEFMRVNSLLCLH